MDRKIARRSKNILLIKHPEHDAKLLKGDDMKTLLYMFGQKPNNLDNLIKAISKHKEGTMDGYDIEPIITGVKYSSLTRTPISIFGEIYRVYTWNYKNNRTIKHYHNGYSSYKQMLSKHPELKG